MSKQLTDGFGRAVKPDGMAIGTCLSCKVMLATWLMMYTPLTCAKTKLLLLVAYTIYRARNAVGLLSMRSYRD